MDISFINQTSYKEIIILYKKEAFPLQKNESVSINISSDDSDVEVLISEKNKVMLNLLFALIDGFVDGESVINSLYCNATIRLDFQQNNSTVILKDLEYRDDKNGYIYESVYMDSSDINDVSYKLKNTDKEQKKAKFYYIFVVSWLPIIAVLLGYCLLFKGNLPAVSAAVLIFFVFTCPSWKKASKVKKYYSNEYANDVLIYKIENQRQHKNDNSIPNDILGKSIFKALDFIFKKK